MNTYPKNSFDLLFTFSKNEKKKFKKNFNEDLIIPIGSAKNNHYHKQEIKKKKILFFSEYKIRRFTYEKNYLKKLR